MKCVCGDQMKRHERVIGWEKVKWWICPHCQAIKSIGYRTEAPKRCPECRHADWTFDLCNHPDADIIEISETGIPALCPRRPYTEEYR